MRRCRRVSAPSSPTGASGRKRKRSASPSLSDISPSTKIRNRSGIEPASNNTSPSAAFLVRNADTSCSRCWSVMSEKRGIFLSNDGASDMGASFSEPRSDGSRTLAQTAPPRPGARCDALVVCARARRGHCLCAWLARFRRRQERKRLAHLGVGHAVTDAVAPDDLVAPPERLERAAQALRILLGAILVPVADVD